MRLINRLFMQGQMTYAIAKYLTDRNIPMPMGKETWRHRTVENILSNEKYKGDARLQKCYTVDFLSKKSKANEGEVLQYYVEGNHDAIIEPVEWLLVRMEIQRRKKLIDENATRKLDQHDYRKKYDGYASRYSALKSRMDSLEKERERKGILYDILEASLRDLAKRRSCRWVSMGSCSTGL